jgi:chromosome segregation ATPase
MDTLSKIHIFLKLDKLLLFQSFFFWKKSLELDTRFTDLEKKFYKQKRELETLNTELKLLSTDLLNINNKNKVLEKKICELHKMVSESFYNNLSEKENIQECLKEKMSETSVNNVGYFSGSRRIITVSLLLGELGINLFRHK